MALHIICESKPPDKPPCKGRLFRFIETSFAGKNGRLVFTRELRPLRSMSCKGCEECGPEADDIKESMAMDPFGAIQFNSGLVHGDTVRLALIEGRLDVASGALQNWHYEAVSIPKEEKKA